MASIHDDSENEKVVDLSSVRAERAIGGKAPLKDLFAQDIARSGLSLEQTRKLGFELLSTDEIWKLLRPKHPDVPSDFTVEGYLIPYYYPSGMRMPFFRIRKLRGRWKKNEDGSQRYASPYNSLPHIYMPVPLLKTMLPKRGKISSIRIVITEGEKKAAKAAACGIFTIALGGVDSYKTARHGVLLLEEFKEWFDFSGTDLEICYDSDAYNNPEVNRALFAISDTLRRDVNPKTLKQRRLVSENAKDKTDLDGFLAQYSRSDDARYQYDKLELREDIISEAFATFNRELVHVRIKTKYYNVATRTWYPSQRHVVEEYAVGTPAIADNGKPVYPIVKWLSDRPSSTTVEDIMYIPGKPEGRYMEHGSNYINMWRPTTLQPTTFKKIEQVKPFLEFMEYLTANLKKEERSWLLDWTAYPLQNPGGKMQSAVLIWSGQGIGKNTYARILRAMYGDHNINEIMGGSLVDQFNEWMQSQICIINEVHAPSYAERASVMNKLKTAITEKVIDLRAMHRARTNVPNFANFYLNSNHSDALLLDDDDRRFFVVEGPEVPWSDQKFLEFNAWLDNGGYEIIYGYLLKRDLKKFNPYAPAPKTEARSAMVYNRSSPIADLIDVLMETPEKIFSFVDPVTKTYKVPKCEVYTVNDMLEKLQNYATQRNLHYIITGKTLGAALKSYKMPKQRMEFGAINKNNRRVITAYAIFNQKYWASAVVGKWRAHLVENSNGLLRK